MNEQKQNPAEIDLYYFFKPIGTAIKKIGAAINFTIRKIMANLVVFIIVVLLITLAGFSLRYIIQPAYRTEGIFISNILPGKLKFFKID